MASIESNPMTLPSIVATFATFTLAVGVMQTLPSTREYVQTVLLERRVPNTVEGDVEVGVAYLKHLIAAFNGNERLALAGWYQGERAVREHGLYKVTLPFVDDVLALRARM